MNTDVIGEAANHGSKQGGADVHDIGNVKSPTQVLDSPLVLRKDGGKKLSFIRLGKGTTRIM